VGARKQRNGDDAGNLLHRLSAAGNMAAVVQVVADLSSRMSNAAASSLTDITV